MCRVILNSAISLSRRLRLRTISDSWKTLFPHYRRDLNTESSVLARFLRITNSQLNLTKEAEEMKLVTDSGNYALLKILAASNIAKKKLEIQIVKADSVKRLKGFPKVQLPYLDLDGIQQLFNPNTICCYLLESASGELVCKETDRARVDELLEWDISSVQPVAFPYIMALTNGNKVDSQLVDIVHQLLAVLNNIIESRGNCITNTTTVADVALWGTLFGVLHDNKEFEDASKRYPAVHNWFNSLSSKEEFQSAKDSVIGEKDITVCKDSFQSALLPLNLCKTSSGGPGTSTNITKDSPLAEMTDGPSAAEVTQAKDSWAKGSAAVPKKKDRIHPVLPDPNSKNILITSALPYVNNVPHLGNIIGCVLSADVYAKYCRLKGHNYVYICGTDEYGTATETKAMEEGVTPRQICDKYNKIHEDVYRWFDIEFDYFGRTTTEQQTRIAQDIFWKLDKNGLLLQDTIDQLHCESCNRFLADRFVEGICPNCGYEDARGDQCDSCGKLINAVELKSPRCKVCRAQPRVKSTTHIFLDLPKIEPRLNNWVEKTYNKGLWSNNAKRITKGWLQEGLRPRCITRDLKWGTPVPMEGFTDKVFYVWFDAPIGYLSITANYTKDWEKWWKNPEEVTLVQFMAKDNVPFHTVVFPCSLIGANDNYTLLHTISATEYLNYEDDKFSKSRGIGVFGDNAADTGIPADIYRFYLLIVRPENQDSVFSWNDFATKNNSELLNNLGNFINRALTFTKNNFKGIIPPIKMTDEDFEMVALVNRELADYVDNLEKIRLREGIRCVLNISKLGNQYMQSNQPWVLVKGSEEERARAGSVLALADNLCALLGQLVSPYMPSTGDRIREQLQFPMEYDVISDIFVPLLPEGHHIGKPTPLFKKIEATTAEELKARFSGGQVKSSNAGQNAGQNAAQGQNENNSPGGTTVTGLEEAVAKQGDVVRKAKAEKVEKSIIDAEVKKLLELKKQLAISKGEDVNQGKDKKKGKKKH